MERESKICHHCKHYIAQTTELEGECERDEDIKSYEYCELYEWKGGR